MAIEITRLVGQYLNIEQGWYHQRNHTPLLRAGLKYTAFTSTRKFTIPLLDNGLADISTIREPVAIFDDGMKFACTLTPSSVHQLSTIPVCHLNALNLADSMICETVKRKSKNTQISRSITDYFRCFDFEIIRNELKESHQTETVSNDNVREKIDQLVSRLFEELDPLLLQIIEFISQSTEYVTYVVFRTKYTVLIAEETNKLEQLWQLWKDHGVLDDVLKYADKKVLEKQSSVSIRMF